MTPSELEAFALGKRLGAAHNDHGWRGVADKCPYDLDSLQPDGYHITLHAAGSQAEVRVKCAGVQG